MQGVVAGTRKFPLFWVVLIVSVLVVSYPIAHLTKTGLTLAGKVPEYARLILDETYPENLEITFQGGQVTTNVTEPFHIKMKVSRLREVLELFDPQGGKNLPSQSQIRVMTIDTTATAEDFDKYQTLILLTRDRLYYDSDGEIKAHELDGVGNVTITKNYLGEKLNELLDNSVLKFFLQFGAFMLIPFLLLMSWGINWLHALFMGLLVYFIGRIVQVGSWNYKRGVVVAVMVFFGFDAIEALVNWLPTIEWPLQILNNIWQVVGFGVIYLLLKKTHEKNN